MPVMAQLPAMTAASNNIAFVTWPGTSITMSLQPKASVTVNEGQTTNFTADRHHRCGNGTLIPVVLVTSGGSFPGVPLTGQCGQRHKLSLSLIPAIYNNAQIYCVASTEIGALSVTSSVGTLTVIQSVFETGWVSEKKWMDVFNIGGAENGTIRTIHTSQLCEGWFLGGT